MKEGISKKDIQKKEGISSLNPHENNLLYYNKVLDCKKIIFFYNNLHKYKNAHVTDNNVMEQEIHLRGHFLIVNNFSFTSICFVLSHNILFPIPALN